MRRLPHIIVCLLVVSLMACRSKQQGADDGRRLPDTLRVATLYSPTSYFIYRDTVMGYDYSLLMSLVQDKHMALDLVVAPSLASAMEMLDSGLIDVIAYEVPVTSEYNEAVLHCGPVSSTTQVLVQPKSGKRITDVTQLIGHDVYVEADSKYEQRMRNLNDEVGGGINVHTVLQDTLITEDLIAMVSEGKIPLTVVDSDIARLNKAYYPELDITMQLSFPQRSAWAVRKDEKWLADSIDAWITTDNPRRENDELLKRFFERSRAPFDSEVQQLKISSGRVSPYDNLFKGYAKERGLDWRLLAAIGYVESGFNNDAVSWAGAKGLMQIMPVSARNYGVDPAALIDPAISISTAAKIFKDLDRSLAAKVPNPKERIKFVVASYNSGLGHIFDAMEIADATGRDPQAWYGNVEMALALKSNPQYYNQPYCRNGYFRSSETINFVHRVMDVYDKITAAVK